LNYSHLLDSYIKESGLSLGEIAKRMQEEKGIKIDRSYLSKLRNDPKYPASDDINRALAEITGGDSSKLILAAYYEKAPKEVQDTLKFSEHYKQIRKILIDSELLDHYFSDTKEERIVGQEREEAVDRLLEELSYEDFIKLWHSSLAFLVLNDPRRFREVAKLVDKRKPDHEYLYQLEKLRTEKNVSVEQMANVLSITPKLYESLELVGGFEPDTEIGKQYKRGIEYLENYVSNALTEGEQIKSDFEEFVNNPEHGIFFKEYLDAPEEKREEMRQIFKILMDKEKGRKPGDRQGD
jgi:transcriptional regulator with XRE-family HTH domain